MKTTHGHKTVIKYYNFLSILYTQGQFNVYEMCQSHSIGSRLITVMRKRNIIERYDDLYRWIGEPPTQALARTLLMQCRADYMQLKRQRNSPQLTIQPVKRVERSQPVPAQEPIYDNSNSKVMLILAVGALIGFMIATLIWK